MRNQLVNYSVKNQNLAGIYIHIPFCKQACTYCNFHFSTSLAQKDVLLKAIEIEIADRVTSDEVIDSVYFGGGTPSLCSAKELKHLLSALENKVIFSKDVEITLECNPDDLSTTYLAEIFELGINRLSIGIQSFYDSDLKFMNRAHNSTEAKTCIQNALTAGFENLTIDLIYGSPTTSNEMWTENIKRALDSGIHHLSSYALTVEEKTKLNHDVKKGKVFVNEETAAAQFDILLDQIKDYGFEQYEISNFCKEEKYAKHNTAYWQGSSYVGLGPAAHSYDGEKRRWNIANNALYIKGVLGASLYWEEEILSNRDRYNEYIMTGLRTKWGINPDEIPNLFGHEMDIYFQKTLAEHPYKDKLLIKDGNITITEEGRFFADAIAASLFKV
ncbi:MAG TPA: radical SAM family heme chaperone HemW [Saprospiraceae bacterium]|nr:radical SAM family heme chaperone HemW [Saprospiraceae bacterium]